MSQNIPARVAVGLTWQVGSLTHEIAMLAIHVGIPHAAIEHDLATVRSILANLRAQFEPLDPIEVAS